jgi:hypothetical protein
MTAAWVAAALLIPWGLGIATVRAAAGQRAGLALRIGLGWFAGQAWVMATLYASLVVFERVWVPGTLVIWGVLGLLLVLIGHRRHAQTDPASARSGWSPSPAVLTCFGILAASLLAKTALILGSHLYSPVRHDDAMTFWLFKAKVIAELGTMPQTPSDPYYLGGSNPHYPVFASLTSAWIALAAGGWREHASILPWTLAYPALVLLVAGGLKRHIGSAASWCVAWLVGTLPLLVVHLFRPGYVDVLLCAYLAATAIVLIDWRAGGSAGLLLLAGLCAAAAACIKREALPLAFLLLAVFVAGGWRRLLEMSRSAAIGLALAALLGVVILARVLDVSDLRDAAGALHYHPEAWKALCRHALGWSSFQFALILIGAAICVLACLGSAPLRGTAICVSIGLLSFVTAVFVLTDYARFALNDQTPSRLLLHVMPAILVVLSAGVVPALGIVENASRSEPEHARL